MLFSIRLVVDGEYLVDVSHADLVDTVAAAAVADIDDDVVVVVELAAGQVGRNGVPGHNAYSSHPPAAVVAEAD